MGHSMLSFLAGLVLAVASSGLFWLVRPVNGTPHRIATTPILETALPLAITSGLVLGVALIVAGIVGFAQP
jgi:hypothetical protein